jgi:PIN domain nuclease of toxin-antitoxin system
MSAAQVSVLDASALIAYANGEPGGAVVDALLQDPNGICYAHAINLCEVFYGAARISGQQTARQLITDLFEDGVVERRDISRRFWSRVGLLKARGGISLADCFCVALAQQLACRVVTADQASLIRWFLSASVPSCPILFIR